MNNKWDKLTIYDKYEKAGVKKIGYVDVEVNNLDADFGEIITVCLGIRNVNGGRGRDNKLRIYRWYVTQKDIKYALIKGKPVQDYRIVKQFLIKLRKENIDLIITHYGIGWRGLDVPFIRARSMKLGLKHLLPRYRTIKYGDVWKNSHQLFRISSYRQNKVADLLRGKSIKTKLDGDIWQMAKIGHRKSIQYILKHNYNDVIELWKNHKGVEDLVAIPSTYV